MLKIKLQDIWWLSDVRSELRYVLAELLASETSRKFVMEPVWGGGVR
jgi:hypothetical protein